MDHPNVNLSSFFSELWSKGPNYALLALIIVLQIRTERRIDDLSDRMEKGFQVIESIHKDVVNENKIQDLKIDVHEKRIDKLETK